MLCLCIRFQLKLPLQCFIHASKDHLILIPLIFHNLVTRYMQSKFRISIRGPLLCNNFKKSLKNLVSETISLFKSKVKNKLLSFSVQFVGGLMTRLTWSSASPFATNLDQTKPLFDLVP